MNVRHWWFLKVSYREWLVLSATRPNPRAQKDAGIESTGEFLNSGQVLFPEEQCLRNRNLCAKRECKGQGEARLGPGGE